MRKVLVSGAAFAATCLAAVCAPAGAGATPLPTPTTPAPGTSTPTVSPSDGGTGTPSGTPGTGGTGSASPTEPPSPEAPGAPGASGGSGTTDGVVSAKAVMVTPRLPKSATYAYGKAAHQRIDAYWRPSVPKAAPRPAVLVLHGGYWLEGDKSGWKYFARRLVAQGYVVLSANYRLAPGAEWPAQRNDSMAALAFMRKHAKVWNLDPQRIAVVGSSSGGMLATQLGTYGTGSQRVRGVIALSPPNNPYLAYQDGAKADASATQRKLRRAVVDLVGCTPGPVAVAACWKRVDDANSASHASAGDAPMLLMHASGDFVPVTQSTGLASALRAAGVPVTVRVVQGDMHASDLLNEEHTYPLILNWLASRLK
ncbi:alpha/beta hydrolase [Actinomadura fibrosa]|uniref:Alpha/beta hydrolase n=1 Tax=Actinomadura fibrosa TaxID=111802 RepID=A0ABW2XF78_9ACTN|nr:alpha/beta hydrolase [Actinomadura fibrosa]